MGADDTVPIEPRATRLGSAMFTLDCPVIRLDGQGEVVSSQFVINIRVTVSGLKQGMYCSFRVPQLKFLPPTGTTLYSPAVNASTFLYRSDDLSAMFNGQFVLFFPYVDGLTNIDFAISGTLSVSGTWSGSNPAFVGVSLESASYGVNWSGDVKVNDRISDVLVSVDAVVGKLDTVDATLNTIESNRQQREDQAQQDAESSISGAISGVDQTLSGPLDMIKAVEQLGDQLTASMQSSGEYQLHFPGVSGPFMPDGSTVMIIQPQDVDMSFLPEKFGVILDAIGLVFLGLCGWKSLDYIYRLIQKILGSNEGEVDG